MSDIPNLKTLTTKAQSKGLTIHRWLKLAGVSQSTYYRAIRTNGEKMMLDTLARLSAAIPSQTIRKTKTRAGK